MYVCMHIYIYIYIYIYMAESLCCTPETNTTLQINYTSLKIFLKRMRRHEGGKKSSGEKRTLLTL